MASIFGTQFETPEEAQRRLVEEQRKGYQSMGNDPGAQFGYALTSALSNLFGQNRDYKIAQKRDDSLSKSQTAAEAIIKQREEESGKQLTDHEKRMIRSAEAASSVSKLGGAENLALASQIRAQMLADNAAEKERQRQIEAHKANVKATETSTQINERNLFEALSRGELEHRIEKIRQMPDGDAKDNLLAQHEGQLKEVALEEERQRAADRRAEEDLILRQETQEWRENQIPAKAQAIQAKYVEEYFADTGEARQILGVANQLEQLTASGASAQGIEYLKKQFGTEDVASAIRAQAQSIIVKEAIQNLPPGVASDKDIELVMSGTMPNTANPEELEQYLRGLAKLRALDASYKRFTAEYISENRNLDGILAAWNDEETINRYYKPIEQEYARASEFTSEPRSAGGSSATYSAQDEINSLSTTD